MNLQGTANHHLQGMVLKPRASTIDPRIAKTGELKRSKGEDGKLYMMLDKKDWNRFHVLSDQEVEDEYRRSIEIEKAVIKSTGRIRPHSASSPGRYQSHSSPATSVSPLRTRPHSANDNTSSSNNNQPHLQYRQRTNNTMGMSPNRSHTHHPQHQQGMGIAMADNNNNNNHNYHHTHPQQTNHRHNLSRTSAIGSSQPTNKTHSYEPPPQYRYTSPDNQGQRNVQQTSQQQQQHDLYDNHNTTISSNNNNHTHPSSSSSPVVLTMGALRAKYEQNLDVIEQLYREKRVLEDRVRSLDYQVHPYDTIRFSNTTPNKQTNPPYPEPSKLSYSLSYPPTPYNDSLANNFIPCEPPHSSYPPQLSTLYSLLNFNPIPHPTIETPRNHHH